MISIRKILLMMVIFACVFTVIASANDKIKGKINNPDGTPYSGKEIQIERIDDPSKKWDATTDDKGNYETDVGTEEHDAEHPYRMSGKSDGKKEDKNIRPDEWHPEGSDNSCNWDQTLHPTLELKKTAYPTTYNAIGQIITYTYEITNTGNSKIYGPISVTDDKLGVIDPCGPVRWYNPLRVGDKTSCTKTYEIQESDLSLPNIVNVAMAKDKTGGKTSNSNAIIVYSSSKNQVPEFPTLTLPVVAVMAIMFFMQRRRKEE